MDGTTTSTTSSTTTSSSSSGGGGGGGSGSGTNTNAVRKRCGRPPKALQQPKQPSPSVDSISSSNDTVQSEELVIGDDVSVLAISPTLEQEQCASPATVSECRRSSRKKIIKFDVRDLLNKNRKPHKIQIEARIDSNAPTTKPASQQIVGVASTSAAAGNTPASSSPAAAAAGSVTTQELTSKQKTFLEKSAIFRRFSCDQQSRITANTACILSPPRQTLLGVEVAGASQSQVPACEAAKISLANRMHRNQEVLSAKRNSSLIVAQMESSNSSSCSSIMSMYTAMVEPPAAAKPKGPPGRRKGAGATAQTKKATAAAAAALSPQPHTPLVPKRRGRPPKNRIAIEALQNSLAQQQRDSPAIEFVEVPKEDAQPSKEAVQQKTNNWTEYKVVHHLAAPIIETVTIEDSNTVPSEEVEIEVKIEETHTHTHQDTPVPMTTATATTRPLVQGQHEHEHQHQLTIEHDVILEISSSSSNSNSEVVLRKGAPVVEVSESKQRNFAAVSFLQESSNTDDDEDAAPDFIVAAVEEIGLDNQISSDGSSGQAAADSAYAECKPMVISNDFVGTIEKDSLVDDMSQHVTESIVIESTTTIDDEISQVPSQKSPCPLLPATGDSEAASNTERIAVVSKDCGVPGESTEPATRAASPTTFSISSSGSNCSGSVLRSAEEPSNSAMSNSKDAVSADETVVTIELEEEVHSLEPAGENVIPTAVNDKDDECVVEEHPVTVIMNDQTPERDPVMQQKVPEECEKFEEIKNATAVVEVTERPAKEPITLPPKKQAGKFKLFQGDVEQGVSIQAIQPAASTLLPDSTPITPNSLMMQNVSVETSTLLHILKTVQSNKEAASVSAASEAALPTQMPENSILCDDSTSTSSSTDRYNSPAEKTMFSRLIKDGNRSSSPRSATNSPQGGAKIVRRYERRSRRGDESANNKTLEETFAEIAAESSKAIRDLAACDALGENYGPKTAPDNVDNAVVKEEVDVGAGTELAEQKEYKYTLREYLSEESVKSSNEVKEESAKGEAARGDYKEPADVVDDCLEAKPVIKKEVEEAQPNCSMKLVAEDEAASTIKEEAARVAAPRRRGRKPKNKKPDDTLSPLTVGAAIPADVQTVKPTEGATAEQVQVEVPPLNEVKSELSIPPVMHVEKVDESTPKQPLKKRLSRIHNEFEMKSEASPPCERAAATSELAAVESAQVGTTTDYVPPSTPSPTSDATHRSRSEESHDVVLAPEMALSSSSKKKHKKFSDDSINLQKEPSSSKRSSDRSDKHKEGDCKSPPTPSTDRKHAGEEGTAEHLENSLDEKSAKKKRQKRLKEAFEAALRNELVVPVQLPNEESTATKSTEDQIDVEMMELSAKEGTDSGEEAQRKGAEAPGGSAKPKSSKDSNEHSDPLKDIEKFIEDGEYLLKRSFKEDGEEDTSGGSQENANEATTNALQKATAPNEALPDEYASREYLVTPGEQDEDVEMEITEIIKGESGNAPSYDPTVPQIDHLSYETPADTPIATPTATPPPKSPTFDGVIDEMTGVRRSHRIKQISKTSKLVGRGLVRDKERFSLKDDVETKTHYSLDDHLMDLAEVEAKNAKFLKEMEERLSNFQVIKENEYKCERVVSREARKMICDCFLTADEEERGELGCGEDCLNRLLMIECGPDCNVRERCTNKRFQKLLCSPCRVFRTEKKGFGIMADIEILPGEFILEYVGEVINGDEFERRRTVYSLDKNRHYYFMALRSDAIIDATIKGNISRFINHSCDPNAETQKWTVNGELRIGFFSRKSIMPGEEITFDYQYQRYGREAQRCYCESANCRGWIGEEPNSDEGEQIDDDSDDDNLAESILADDDDEDDSDDSTIDAEEVKKKLEIAAAAAKLTPITEEGKAKLARDKKKKAGDKDAEEDSKSKFKKLLSKISEKVAKKKKQKEEKKQRKKRTSSPNDLSAKKRYLEDPDIEDEVHFLSRCGLKNQLDTLRLSRLMVRAKLVQTRLNLLEILRKGDFPCRRLFLDYHGLRLLHGWMSEDGGDMNIRMALLETLESLPIANKSVLTDSKVYQTVREWCETAPASLAGRPSVSPSDEAAKESASQPPQQALPTSAAAPVTAAEAVCTDLVKLSSKLTATWDSLPEIFRIPKRERIEQMKEHEREADRQYAEAVEEEDDPRSINADRHQRDRFGRSLTNRFTKPYANKEVRTIGVVGANPTDVRRRPVLEATASALTDPTKHLSKDERRKMFAAKVARDEVEKRLAEERLEFDMKCRFFGLDPKKTHMHEVPFCVNPGTGQWYSITRQPIRTPPIYAHVPLKPKSTNPIDYQLPAAVSKLPPQWRYSISTQGHLYYYHLKDRIPQWEPPTSAQANGIGNPQAGKGEEDEESESESEESYNDSSSEEDDEELLVNLDQSQLKTYVDQKVEARRLKRLKHLVDARPISPRREEDRIYNQNEVRKYKENKEKIRKRKEEIRRKRSDPAAISAAAEDATSTDAAGATATATATAASAIKSNSDSDDETVISALPIQDYLLSSDEEDLLKEECNNSPLIDAIVRGDKIVDELDALTTNRPLKRTLPPHRDLMADFAVSVRATADPGTNAETSSSSISSLLERHEQKRRKLEKKEKMKKPKDSDSSKYRRLKEKFRCEIAGIIVQYLKPFRKDSCLIGRISNDDDFNHLARKLTHFVMIKELRYCESIGQTLVVTESVKNKSREFIKKYMVKYGEVYTKPTNDPEYKDIPFTL